MDVSIGQVLRSLPVTLLSWVVFISYISGVLCTQSSTLCLQYYDHDENVVPRIDCPSYYNETKKSFDIEVCCGGCFRRYCCKEFSKQVDQDSCKNHLNPKSNYLPVGLIVACLIGALAMVVGCFLFASFYESCLCFKGKGLKERRMQRPPPVHKRRRKLRELRYERPPGPDVTMPRYALPAMHPDVEANPNSEQCYNHNTNFQETVPLFPLTDVSPYSETIDNEHNEVEKEKHKPRIKKTKEPDDTIRLTELPDDTHDGRNDEPDHSGVVPRGRAPQGDRGSQRDQPPNVESMNQEIAPNDEGPPPYEQVGNQHAPQHRENQPSSPILGVL